MKVAEILVLTMTFAFGALAAPQRSSDGSSVGYESRQEPASAQSGRADPALAVAWNAIVNDIAFAEDQFFTFKGHRAHAMMHIAMHDALNAVTPLYRQYAYLGRAPGADPIAAAARAARDVVLSQYPGQQVTVDAELANWLSQVPDTPGKARGITLGQQCASAILAMRVGDGWDFWDSYTFSPAVGAYQSTPPFDGPPFNGFVFQPGFRYARPFGLLSPSQFRPAPPPALTSADYTAAYNEVKNFGRVDSAFRTADQTSYAVWWMEFAEGSVNRLARQLVTQRKTHLWQAARMFALINMSFFDGYVADWDAKFEFNHWRPYTAIRQAALDGNSGTEADSAWEPLGITPPHPEYVSAHATACAASFELLKRTFGADVPFTMGTTTAPPGMPTRSFPSFSAAAAECADSRVRLGWHFRYATDGGLALGLALAGWLDEHHLEFRGASSH